MKHIIATILVLCLCAGLWACSSPKKAEAKPQPTTEQNMLTQVKLGAPRSQAEKVFGASTHSEKTNVEGHTRYYYAPVTIYYGNFEPYVIVDEAEKVIALGYMLSEKVYGVNHSQALTALQEQFTSAYGDPEQPEDKRFIWQLENGTRLLLVDLNPRNGTYRLVIDLAFQK